MCVSAKEGTSGFMNPTLDVNPILGVTEVEINEQCYVFDRREKALMLFPDCDNRL